MKSSTCKICGGNIVYDAARNLRLRWVCDSCKKDARKKYLDLIALKPGQSTIIKSGLARGLDMSTTALVLGMSRQGVDQTERRAMMKLRKAFGQYLAEGCPVVPPRPKPEPIDPRTYLPVFYTTLCAVAQEEELQALTPLPEPDVVICLTPTTLEERYRHFRETGEIILTEDPAKNIEQVAA